MNKIVLLALSLALVQFSNAQTIINTFTGNGTSGFSGDNGPATAAVINGTFAGCVDDSGNVYVTDVFNSRVRKVNPYTGIIITIAGGGTSGLGDGGPATAAQVIHPEGVAADAAGNLYMSDLNNQRIRKVTKSTGIISTIAGSGSYGFSGDGGQATNASMETPIGVAVDDSGNVYFADHYNGRIRKVTVATGIITTIAGGGSNPGTDGVGDGGPGTGASLNQPDGIAVDDSGNVYIADQWNHIVRKVTKKTGIITCIAGMNGNAGYAGDGGPGTAAQLYTCSGVAVDVAGNVYIADTYNNEIREVTKSTGIINTIAGFVYMSGSGNGGYSGDGGPATAAELDQPYGVAVDNCGNVFSFEFGGNRARMIYVPDTVKVTPNSASTCGGGNLTFSATGANAYAWSPSASLNDSTGAVVIATPLTATTYTVIGLSSCSGWLTLTPATVPVTIGGTLSVSITPALPSVCNGQSVTLVANAGVNATYNWVGTGDITDSLSVNPSKDTTYELIVGNGSCTKDTLITVKVNTAPALIVYPQSPVELCNGQNVVLIADTTGSGYTWSPGTGLSATTGSTVTASPTIDVTYTVTGMDSLGCSVSATEDVIVNSGPNQPSITISANGDTLFSSAKNGNQWYKNDTIIPGATDSILIITGNATTNTYKVVVTDVANGCSTTSGSFMPSGIDPLAINGNQLSVYPNPTNSLITVTISSSVGEVKNWSLQLTDVLGRTLYTRQSLNYNNEIDLSNLPGGIYFITVINKTSRAVFPVVKQN